MSAEDMEGAEERVKSFLSQLQTECGILNRLVYKNKNQHRRSSYFQYLLKVKRDLKLLQSSHIEDLLDSCFNAVTGKKAKQKIYFLESLKKKCNNGKYNMLERLLGVARLLSQMVEPTIRTAVEISQLLARSFFMGFSLTVLALLARIRVLVQQMLLDVVVLFNEVSSISRSKQSMKITQDGLEIFREYFPPTVDEFVTLECVWETDKFVLFEKLQKAESKHIDEHPEDAQPPQKQAVKYQSLGAFLGVSELRLKKALGADILGADGSFEPPSDQMIDGTKDSSKEEEESDISEPPCKKLNSVDGLVGSSTSNQMPTTSFESKSVWRNKVAFISVKKPAVSSASMSTAAGVELNETESKGGANKGDNGDLFFSLLASGTTKGSLI